MKDSVMKYLIEEAKLSPKDVDTIFNKISKYPDIYDEFCAWLSTRDYSVIKDSPIMVEGYSAKMIAEIAPFLQGIGIYNMLITLRDHPERGKEYIAKGFPKK